MPDGGEREPYHHGDLRNALCKHAVRIIETGGVEALSLRDAARALGVSPSAVYRHFEDKAALIAAVVADGFARLEHAMETAARNAEERGQEARAVLGAIGVSYVRFAAAHPTHFRTMAEAPAAARGTREMIGHAVDHALGAGASVGERRAARRATFAAIHGLAVLVAAGSPAEREPAACDAAAREVLVIVLRGIQRDAGMGVSANEKSPAPPASRPAFGPSSSRGTFGPPPSTRGEFVPAPPSTRRGFAVAPPSTRGGLSPPPPSTRGDLSPPPPSTRGGFGPLSTRRPRSGNT